MIQSAFAPYLRLAMLSDKLSDQTRQYVVAATVFFAIFTILAIRSRHAVILPVIGFEDGRDMLAFYFHNGNPSAILRFYNGYISLLPNALGWAATRFPLPVAPYIFTLAALMLATTGFYLLTRNGHAWLISSPRDRIITGIMLALLPLGKSYMINNLTYSQWSMLFLLIILLTRAPIPTSLKSLTGYTLVVILLIFSHPLSILAIPLCLIQFALNKQWPQRFCLAVCLFAIIGYQLTGVQHTSSVVISIDSLMWALKVFLARVIFESVFGTHVTTLLINGGSFRYVCGMGVCILGLVFGMVLASARPHRNALIAWAAIMSALAIVWISTLTRYTEPEARMIHLAEPYLQRYIYVPKLIFASIILCQAAPLFFACTTGRIWIRTLFLASLFFYLASVNYNNAYLYRESVAEGLQVREFLRLAHSDLKRAKEGQSFQSLHTLDRGGIWDIIIVIDGTSKQ